MVQQRAIQKNHEDDHCCACLYKYAREMAVTFLCTDDKNKIREGEPSCPISAFTCGY